MGLWLLILISGMVFKWGCKIQQSNPAHWDSERCQPKAKQSIKQQTNSVRNNEKKY